MKDTYIADRAISAIEQLQVDPELVAVGTDVVYDVRGEVTVIVRFQHDPKKEEKFSAPAKTEKAPEGGYATGGIIDKPALGLFGAYTEKNDRELTVRLDSHLTKIFLDLCAKAEAERGFVSQKIGILDAGRENPSVVKVNYSGIAGFHQGRGNIGRSTATPETGEMASVEKSVVGNEDGTAVGERDESPESRARHHFDEGVDR